MAIDLVRQLHQARPFRPFRLHLADGRDFDVPHAELMAVSPGGRTLSIYVDEGWIEHIDLLLVTSIEELNGSRSKRRRR
jgi:hypothetical protein